MIKSIRISNYRNLREVHLTSCEQINLITGKNNTGKSSVLEAILLYVKQANVNFISQLLEERGENLTNFNRLDRESFHINLLSSLFFNRKKTLEKGNMISIHAKEQDSTMHVSSSHQLSIGFCPFQYAKIINDDLSISTKTVKLAEISDDMTYYIGLEVSMDKESRIISLEEEQIFGNGFRNFTKELQPCQYVKTSVNDKNLNSKLFDNIALTQKEQYVIEALQIIDPTIERIAFIDEGLNNRTAVVKLSNSDEVFPLKSMGDGINRILTIILALVNSDNGYVVIDEFENGLHYSVQVELWTIVLNLANKLNVQVFATTHSDDCIKGLSQAMSNTKSTNGKLYRLENENDVISCVEYNATELNMAFNYDIETR